MKNSLANLVAEGNCIQMSDRWFRYELAPFLHKFKSKSLIEGIHDYEVGFNDVISF